MRPKQKHVVLRLCAAPEECSFSKSHWSLSSMPGPSLLWWSHGRLSPESKSSSLFGLGLFAEPQTFCACVAYSSIQVPTGPQESVSSVARLPF